MKKLAVVTGGSRGIGFALAKYLASKKYNLVLIAKNSERLKTAQEHLQASYPDCLVNCHAIDLNDTLNAESVIGELLESHPPVDLLINNAGAMERGMTDIPAERLLDLFKTNSVSSLLIANAVAEQMKRRKSGYIINMASLAGVLSMPKIGIYSATKGAIISYSKALFKELLHHNVRVSCLCPSVVNTDMTDDGLMDNTAKIQPSDLVNSVDYLLSLGEGALVERLDIYCKPIAQRDYPA